MDWSRTPLGPAETWPRSLKTSISIMLASRFAMVIAWGPQFRFVILLSARAGEEARVEGLTAGADDYLVKPFSAR